MESPRGGRNSLGAFRLVNSVEHTRNSIFSICHSPQKSSAAQKVYKRALSVIASQCHCPAPPCFRHWRRSSPLLPKGEALAGRKAQKSLSEIAAPRGAGYLAKWENSDISSCKNALCQGGNLPISWHSDPTLPKGAECQVGKLAKYNVDILLNSHFAI